MRFKELFVTGDAGAAPAPKSAQAPPLQGPPMFSQPTPTGTLAFGVDPEIKAGLMKALDEKKLPGYDYLKYVATLEKMKNSIPGEDARFKLVYEMAQQMGVDKSKLAESAQHYIQVLSEESKDFQASLSNAMQTNVTVREKHLADIDQQIQARQAQIEKINSEIASAQLERNEVASKVAEFRAKLDTSKASFEATCASCVSEIQANIQKINQYLQ